MVQHSSQRPGHFFAEKELCGRTVLQMAKDLELSLRSVRYSRTRGVLLVFFLVAWELAWEGLGAQTAPRLTGTHRDGVRGGSSHK